VTEKPGRPSGALQAAPAEAKKLIRLRRIKPTQPSPRTEPPPRGPMFCQRTAQPRLGAEQECGPLAPREGGCWVWPARSDERYGNCRSRSERTTQAGPLGPGPRRRPGLYHALRTPVQLRPSAEYAASRGRCRTGAGRGRSRFITFRTWDSMPLDYCRFLTERDRGFEPEASNRPFELGIRPSSRLGNEDQRGFRRFCGASWEGSLARATESVAPTVCLFCRVRESLALDGIRTSCITSWSCPPRPVPRASPRLAPCKQCRVVEGTSNATPSTILLAGRGVLGGRDFDTTLTRS